MRTLFRWSVILGVSVGAAVVAAVALAVFDIYLTGHGSPSILRPWIDWSAAGVHLSRGDVVMLIAMALAGFSVWFVTRP